MKDYSRSLIIGIILIIAFVIYIVISSYKIAIFCGILGVVWLVKAFIEWRKNKKQSS